MTDPLILYTNPMSRGRTVRWMLEEVGCDYRTELVGYGEAMRQPDYLAINPMAKVPAIRHGDRVVTEVAAICAYLADAFPDAGLAPAPATRADYYRWLFFAAGPFEQAITNAALKVEVPPERRGMTGYGSIERVLDTLEAKLAADDYVAEDRFTAADCVLGAGLAFQLAFGTIAERPAFRGYVDRLHARPAFARATEIDGPMPG